MRNLTEENVIEAVLAKLENCANPRLKQIMTSLVTHLHAFVREVELTEEEWFHAIGFLTRTGQICDDKRQEFILLSDTLGVSILVDAIAHRKPAGATESSVFGPFHVPGAPELPNGASIVRDPRMAANLLFEGRVTDPDGNPIAGALLDVWQTGENGLYDVQDPEQPEMNLRGRFRSDAEGRCSFRTIPPVCYPIPDDGPVGDMLKATGRHPWRPAHIHFMISAPGYETLITMLFTEGDRYLDSDAVFGVKSSLVIDPKPDSDGKLHAEYTFGLKPAVGADPNAEFTTA